MVRRAAGGGGKTHGQAGQGVDPGVDGKAGRSKPAPQRRERRRLFQEQPSAELGLPIAVTVPRYYFRERRVTLAYQSDAP